MISRSLALRQCVSRIAAQNLVRNSDLVLASVAPVPLVPVKAEEILAEKPSNEATILEASQAAMDACTPIDDVRGSARYRKYMVRNLTRRALQEILAKTS